MAGRKRKPDRRALALEKKQQKLWNLCLALCVVLFFVLSVHWIGIELGWFAVPDEHTQAMMELADMTAIGVFVLELYARYKKTPDKMQFLRHNWLEIIVLLPVGVIFRVARGVEGISALRAVPFATRLGEEAQAAVRSFPIAVKLGEEGMLMPEIVATGRVAARTFEAFHKWLTNFHVIGDFLRMVWEHALGFFRKL